ncbi:MAG: metallophosphoesterase family protein [Nocardioides sp.]
MRLPASRSVLDLVACLAAAAAISTPVATVLAIRTVSFSDYLGTVPVEVSLSHNGTSSLDTGIFGTVYADRTGPLGFGATARVTGTPQAAGTLASYVDPKFLRVYVTLIDDPDQVVDAYGTMFGQALRTEVLRNVGLGGIGLGVVLFYLIPRTRLRQMPRGQMIAACLGLTLAGTAVSGAAAGIIWDRWPGSDPVSETYAMDSVDGLSFSSPQTREVAQQIQPFVNKNLTRMETEARAYETAAGASFAAALATTTDVAPRDGERIVIAEADTQGSQVGAAVRTQMYADLVARLGPDAFVVRTIAGDITSNGAVAESGYLAEEGRVSPTMPTLVAAGDHDSETTWEQFADARLTPVDLETTEVDGIRVAGAHDREHKSLFGALVTNREGISEEELGQQLRRTVDDQGEPVAAIIHQPVAAAAYLGLDAVQQLADLPRSLTTPVDDGVADVPAGSLSYGHWHQADGPWVLWNTDGDRVTWTVVDQLGTAGGVENAPTISSFSTPISAPLKDVMVRLHYVDQDSGLTTGFVTIECTVQGICTISDRVDVGLPGGQPG